MTRIMEGEDDNMYLQNFSWKVWREVTTRKTSI